MGQVKFGGTWWSSMRAAAEAWAMSALPDVSVIESSETPEEAATNLESFVWGEGQKSDEGAPDDLDEQEWRDACRRALAERIEASRKAA